MKRSQAVTSLRVANPRPVRSDCFGPGLGAEGSRLEVLRRSDVDGELERLLDWGCRLQVGSDCLGVGRPNPERAELGALGGGGPFLSPVAAERVQRCEQRDHSG